MGKTDRFTNNCFYLNGSWYWRGIFPVKYHEIPQKHVSLPTPTPFFHLMTPVWDRSPADWGWPKSSKQQKFEFEESRIAKLYIYIYICILNSLLSIRPRGGQPRFTRKPKVYSSLHVNFQFVLNLLQMHCFEVETLEKHPNCKTLSRLGLLCLCPIWKTLVVLNLPCNAAHCTV